MAKKMKKIRNFNMKNENSSVFLLLSTLESHSLIDLFLLSWLKVLNELQRKIMYPSTLDQMNSSTNFATRFHNMISLGKWGGEMLCDYLNTHLC